MNSQIAASPLYSLLQISEADTGKMLRRDDLRFATLLSEPFEPRASGAAKSAKCRKKRLTASSAAPFLLAVLHFCRHFRFQGRAKRKKQPEAAKARCGRSNFHNRQGNFPPFSCPLARGDAPAPCACIDRIPCAFYNGNVPEQQSSEEDLHILRGDQENCGEIRTPAKIADFRPAGFQQIRQVQEIIAGIAPEQPGRMHLRL